VQNELASADIDAPNEIEYVLVPVSFGLRYINVGIVFWSALLKYLLTVATTTPFLNKLIVPAAPPGFLNAVTVAVIKVGLPVPVKVVVQLAIPPATLFKGLVQVVVGDITGNPVQYEPFQVYVSPLVGFVIDEPEAGLVGKSNGIILLI